MNKKGPVIISEDDVDDKEILQQVFDKLAYSNKVVFFDDGETAFGLFEFN
jgi:uncharacterized protein (DUF1919 family)